MNGSSTEVRFFIYGHFFVLRGGSNYEQFEGKFFAIRALNEH
ncbi:hypothetical protein CLV25_11759 [Acetobacteroides hydrogenigenes]|uniref:Uncharacterized protein n=1 Tax=Acetobacteroides hydrogenigenes TaxID=979970 RepID=A0A4V2RNA4_9BACT|nr:hypothetical protein CLV25_11759 [Acetobacteroides hydrogenigenes]